MRISFSRWAVAAAAAAVLMTGCQTGGGYNRFSMRNLWPWGKKEKAAETALARSGTQTQLPSQSAAAAGTTGAYNGTAGYPEVASNTGYADTGYGSANTQVSYGAQGSSGTQWGSEAAGAGQGGQPAYDNYAGAVANN